MKKFSSSSQMLSENLKKYLKRAGIIVVSTSLGVASFITVASDESNVHSKAKLIGVAQTESTVIEDTKVEYSKIEYSDLQETISETEQLAKVEKTEKETEAVALAKEEETTEEESGYTLALLSTETSVTTEIITTEATTTEKATTEKATTEAVTTTEEAEEEVELAASKKNTTSSNEKQQLAIEATETEEEVTAIAIEVEDDSYESGTYLGTYTATAYCGCSKCCGKSDGITASGTKATQGRTVAAPSTFAFGTELIIDGHTYVVEDRGGSIKGKRIDIYFNSHSEALKFGRRTVEVYVK